ncbi:MAG: hypothetical protein WEA99_12400 [Brumimicrobium sp.]
MKVDPPFYIRDNYSSEILNLLKTVTLGSNGARYRHRNIEQRIKNLYKPLYLNLERSEKILGNLTLCRREVGWYVRYFAFDPKMQTNQKTKVKPKTKTNKLKTIIQSFFADVFDQGEDSPKLLYAYIDPRNERSLWMSQNFGFYTVAKIATQTFSRVRPKRKDDVVVADDLTFIKEKIKQEFSNLPLYFDHHTFNESPFYELVKEGETVAFAKTHSAEWVIERLPGKRKSFLMSIIPYVPGVRKVVRPAAHKFTVVDTVWAKESEAKYMEELFEGILEKEDKNTMVWWVDTKDLIYKKLKKKINWGLLNKINGTHEVDLVIKNNSEKKEKFSKPTYVTGFDFI